MDEMTTIQIAGIGPVRTQRHGTALLVHLGDILEALDRKTPTKVAIKRTPAKIRARIREGHRMHYLINVESATASVGGYRGVGADRIVEAVAGLMAAREACRAGLLDIPEAARRRAAPGKAAHEERPDGVTAVEMIRALGLRNEIDPRQAAKWVSDKYLGERHRHPDGVLFEDRAQVAELVTGYSEWVGARQKAMLDLNYAGEPSDL